MLPSELVNTGVMQQAWMPHNVVEGSICVTASMRSRSNLPSAHAKRVLTWLARRVVQVDELATIQDRAHVEPTVLLAQRVPSQNSHKDNLNWTW
jgi:hypothetical protein